MNEEQTVAYRLFHTPWLISIPDIFFRGRKVAEEYGFVTTGNKEWDKALQMQSRQRYTTIPGMISLFEEGANITLVSPKDAVDIYDLIMDHLKNWQHIANSMFNVEVPPMEDLLAMDEFAKAIHPICLAQNEGKKTDLTIHAKMKSIHGKHSGLFMETMRRRILSADTEETATKRDPNMHQSIADRIARQVWSR